MLFLEETEPRAIVANPKLLERAIDHYTQKENMPDITDKPEMSDSSMCLWLKQKRKSRLRPHSVMKGVCGTWMNHSYDYAIP